MDWQKCHSESCSKWFCSSRACVTQLKKNTTICFKIKAAAAAAVINLNTTTNGNKVSKIRTEVMSNRAAGSNNDHQELLPIVNNKKRNQNTPSGGRGKSPRPTTAPTIGTITNLSLDIIRPSTTNNIHLSQRDGLRNSTKH